MDVKPITFYSSALNCRRTYYVLLPPSYNDTEKSYPVLFLLHGMNGGETDWIYKGNAVKTVQRMYDNNELRESIIVMPSDGGYDRGTFYMDWYDGSGNFEQYFIYDLIPNIDQQFRTERDARFRGIGGLSMGGYGSFMLSLRHPKLFGIAVSLSGALAPLSYFSEYERARLIGPVEGPHAKKYELARLASSNVTEALRPKLYFNCGKDDYLYEGNVWFKNYLDSIHYDAQFEEFSGEHNWEYWQEHLVDLLRFFEYSIKG